MTDSDITPRTPVDCLRVNDLMPRLIPYLSERSRQIFKNVRVGITEECFFYGRITDAENIANCEDFAVRLNKLFDTFNGFNEYYCYGKTLQPRVTSCLTAPMSMPLAPSGNRKCKICGRITTAAFCSGVGSHGISTDFIVENPIPRILFMAYVFVEGIDLGVLHNSWEEARLWLNSITRSFISASREGELPVNSPQENQCP